MGKKHKHLPGANGRHYKAEYRQIGTFQVVARAGEPKLCEHPCGQVLGRSPPDTAEDGNQGG